MEYREGPPPRELAPFVAAVWTLSGVAPAAAFDLVLPDGCAELVIHRTGRFREWRGDGTVRQQPHAIVAGVMDRAVALSPATSFETVGVRFWPQGLAQLCACPLRDLSDDIAAAEDVLIPTAAHLVSTAAQARSMHDAMRILLAGLTGLYPRGEPAPASVRAAIQRIRRTGGTGAMDALARETGLSARALERHFDRWVGLSPKRYARVVRFHRVAGRLVSAPDLPAAALAVDYGYYDQAHLTRDFRAFTGWAPRAFLSGRLGELTRHFAPGGASDSSKTAVDAGGDTEPSGGCL
jgi:AraC-like DNA-binding protein